MRFVASFCSGSVVPSASCPSAITIFFFFIFIILQRFYARICNPFSLYTPKNFTSFILSRTLCHAQWATCHGSVKVCRTRTQKAGTAHTFFVCAIPALCFLISRFSGWNSPEFVLPKLLPGSYSSCGRTSESINSQISSLPCLVSAENGMIIVPGCTPSPSRIALTFF